MLAKASHTNIIKYNQQFTDEENNIFCLVTEYADDGNLYDKIQN
jgi:serine/threonine protein kinase